MELVLARPALLRRQTPVLDIDNRVADRAVFDAFKMKRNVFLENSQSVEYRSILGGND